MKSVEIAVHIFRWWRGNLRVRPAITNGFHLSHAVAALVGPASCIGKLVPVLVYNAYERCKVKLVQLRNVAALDVLAEAD